MSDWDDDDFVPETVAAAPAAPVEQSIDNYRVPSPQPQKKVKPKYMEKEDQTYAMEDLGRELTTAEREAIQRKTDRAFARELMGGEGADDDEDSWQDAASKEDFEHWGDKIAKWASQRHKAAHYGDFLSKLLAGLSKDLDATDIRKMSNLLKQIADDKKKETDKAKPVASVGKKKAKTAVKSTGGKGRDDLDDYGTGGGSGWRGDDDDDFM
ncbi:unnamed protein product, partial [Mesorhabditis spiculigera]